MSEDERIEAAAILVNDEVWTLPPPTRHHTLIQAWASAHWKDGKAGRIGEHDQGFVTSAGRYVDREEAATIARAAGQTDSTRSILFSEDVW